MKANAEERPHHHDVALGEIDLLGGLVDQHKAKREQAVDAALRNARNDQLQEFQTSAPWRAPVIWALLARIFPLPRDALA